MPVRSVDDYLDALTAETLSEVADSFFSRRKDLEDSIDRFTAQVEAVKERADAAMAAMAAMRRLLFGQEGLAKLVSVLGIERPGALVQNWPEARPWIISPPFALTAKGRYRKCLFLAYEHFAATVREYREGVYEADPRNPKRKRLTPNYQSLEEMGKALNEQIRSVNEDQPPSSVLSFAKGLNPEEVHRERITGATLGGMADMIDADMSFDAICFDGLCVPFFPELPPLAEVRDRISGLGDAQFAAHPGEAAALLSALSSPA